MKTAKEYEQIIKKLIFNNMQSWPYYENESDDIPNHFKFVIYYSPYHTFVFNGKPDDKAKDVLDYLFNKVMEVEK